MSSESREQPVKPYEAGNEADFERLYRATYNRVLGTLVVVLGDRAAAEDCTQEAFVKAFHDWRGWRGDAPAEAWVHRIAINTAISHQRHERMREVGQLLRRLGRPGPPPDPARVAERSDLVKALGRLSPKLRAAIVLRHHHGYTNREIGATLGIPERTVASRLAAAKEQLRKALGRDPEIEPQIEVGTFSEDGVPSD